MVESLSHVQLSQAHGLSLPGSSVHGISQARRRSRLPFPSPEDLPAPGIEPASPVETASPVFPVLQVDFLPTELSGKPLASLVTLQMLTHHRWLEATILTEQFCTLLPRIVQAFIRDGLHPCFLVVALLTFWMGTLLGVRVAALCLAEYLAASQASTHLEL